jgi:hypothetical protein
MALRLANLVKEGQHLQLNSKLLTQFMTTIKCCGMYAVGDPRAVENFMKIAEGVDYVMSKVAYHRRATLMSNSGYANNNGGMGNFYRQGQIDAVAGAQAPNRRSTFNSQTNGNSGSGTRSPSRSTTSSGQATSHSAHFNFSNNNNISGSHGSYHSSHNSAHKILS